LKQAISHFHFYLHTTTILEETVLLHLATENDALEHNRLQRQTDDMCSFFVAEAPKRQELMELEYEAGSDEEDEEVNDEFSEEPAADH
jgi:hypothetical protein